MGFLITSLLKILPRNLETEKNCKSVKVRHIYGREFVPSVFLAHPVGY